MARIYFSSRHSGNFGDHVGDDPVAVAERRARLAQTLSLDSVAFMNQVHGDEFYQISESDGRAPTCDALMTTVKGIGLAVMVADCIPLLLASERVVAAVHVGRPGLVVEIAPKVISAMRGLGASSISAHVGASICRDCYEVAPDMYREISSQIPATATTDAVHSLDLVAGLRSQIGDEVSAWTDLHICAKESSDHFSYRRENKTGRQVGVVAL